MALSTSPWRTRLILLWREPLFLAQSATDGARGVEDSCASCHHGGSLKNERTAKATSRTVQLLCSFHPLCLPCMNSTVEPLGVDGSGKARIPQATSCSSSNSSATTSTSATQTSIPQPPAEVGGMPPLQAEGPLDPDLHRFP